MRRNGIFISGFIIDIITRYNKRFGDGPDTAGSNTGRLLRRRKGDKPF